MIKIYYTGATKHDLVQNQPFESLGGTVSTSVVPNSRTNSLFGQAPRLPDLGMENEYIGIVIENNTGSDISSLNIHIDKSANNTCEFDFCIVSVNEYEDCPGVFYIEQIPDKHSKPMVGNFNEYSSLDPAEVEDFLKDMKLGIWIRRKCEGNPQDSCEKLMELNNADDTITEIQEYLEEFSLVFEY
jgi:hypothetical protein